MWHGATYLVNVANYPYTLYCTPQVSYEFPGREGDILYKFSSYAALCQTHGSVSNFLLFVIKNL